MNYRHAYHAGNFADVVKHVALVALLQHLNRKEKPYRVIDTHAGRGIYDLSGDEAARTGEADEGIAKLRVLGGELPAALAKYLEIAGRQGEARYPGSPLIAAQLLRPQDKLTAIEKHPEEFAALAATLAPFRKAKAVEADGYARLTALLPPQERRGLVLLDPPYEAEDEFGRVGVALAAALKRFATGIYLIWFPVKSKSDAERFCGEMLAAGAQRLLRIDVEIAPKLGDKERLARAGLAIVNPPYGFEDEMRAALSIIAPLLGARYEIVRLAGKD